VHATARTRVTALLALPLLVIPTACTSDQSAPNHARQTVASTPVMRGSVPFRVEVTHVAGKLATKRRAVLAAHVRRTLTWYVDSAFLRTDYPAARFAGAARPFARTLASAVRRDRALLTNAPLARSTRSVRATHRTAYLSVLAPHGSPAGVTAAVDLVFAVDRGDRPAQRVELEGRLLLTPAHGGGWRIFGYDLDRSQRPVRSAS
jgi:hypothetical protein